MKVKKPKPYRGTWSIKPTMRIKESGKVYNRKKLKKPLANI